MAIIDTTNTLNALTSAYLTAAAVNTTTASSDAATNRSTASAVNQAALQRAVDLAADAFVVVSLSSANVLNQTAPLTSLTYNAAGLLNTAVAANAAATVADTIRQANEANQSDEGTTDTGDTTNLTTDQASDLFYTGVLSGLATAQLNASVYTGAGQLSGIDTSYALQLAQVLQANPDLAETISDDIAAQGVTGALLSVTA